MLRREIGLSGVVTKLWDLGGRGQVKEKMDNVRDRGLNKGAAGPHESWMLVSKRLEEVRQSARLRKAGRR